MLGVVFWMIHYHEAVEEVGLGVAGRMEAVVYAVVVEEVGTWVLL